MARRRLRQLTARQARWPAPVPSTGSAPGDPVSAPKAPRDLTGAAARAAMCWLGPSGIRIYQAGGSWREVVAHSALTDTARNLTGAILLMYPELRLADVMPVIPVVLRGRPVRPRRRRLLDHRHRPGGH